MNHHTTPDFWACYDALSAETRHAADKAYSLLRDNPRHPSLHLKKVGQFWSARVSSRYRALAVEGSDGLVWFWIGVHAEYDRTLG